MIKAQYLGGEKKKKKVLKGAEKFKFNFDWAADDDTSRDLNPLYNQTHGVLTPPHPHPPFYITCLRLSYHDFPALESCLQPQYARCGP